MEQKGKSGCIDLKTCVNRAIDTRFCSTISIQESKCFVPEKYLTIIRSKMPNILKESFKIQLCNHHILKGLR